MALEESRRVVVHLGGNNALALNEDLSGPNGGRSFREAAVESHVPGHANHEAGVCAGEDEASARDERDLVGGGHQDDESGNAGAET